MDKQTFDMDWEDWKKLIDIDEWNDFVRWQHKFSQMAIDNKEEAKKMFFWFKFGKHLQGVKPNERKTSRMYTNSNRQMAYSEEKK